MTTGRTERPAAIEQLRRDAVSPPETAERGRRGVPRTLSSLSVRNYRIYAGGTLVSNIGTWMQRIGQDWLVLQLTGNSGAAVATTTALQFLPILFLSPVAGLLADRFPKRRYMQVTQVMMLVPSVVLGALAISGDAQPWHVYVLAFLFGVGSAMDTPARQSFVPELVGPEHVVNAIGLNSVSFNLGRVLGPSIAGLLIAALGSGPSAAGWTILINGVSYSATVVALQAIDPARLSESDRPPRTRGMIVAGARSVATRSDLVAVLILASVTAAWGINFPAIIALMSTQVFDVGAEQFGLLGTATAVGAFTGALIGARRTSLSLRVVEVAALAVGGAFLLCAAMPDIVTFAGSCAVAGLCTMLMTTASQSYVQLFTPAPFRGRVTALYVMATMGAVPLGSLLVGWVDTTWGARWTMVVGGIVALVAAVSVLGCGAMRSGHGGADQAAGTPAWNRRVPVRPAGRAG